ncbi:MAG: hypothetical protein HY226_06720 [Candidatus Vogelbacteria bacterium]|nr:hypothetical protein [Candidatus Vogelbacteria bacterium]
MIVKSQKKGAGIMEVIVGLAIVMLGVFVLLRTYNYYLKFGLLHKYDVQAALLAEEGIEAVKLLRDSGWTNKISTLNSGIVYRLAFVNSSWTSTTTVKYIDGVFDRTFVLSDVYRDSNDDVANSGTLDPGTRKLIVFVAYRSGLSTTTKSISAYITNLFAN